MSKPAHASPKKIGIIGGGPAALYLLKEFTGKTPSDYTIEIFEAGSRLGCGMPYSEAGANPEHITNVSANEIPELNTPFTQWIDHVSVSRLINYGINKSQFHEYKVVPHLLFGEYLEDQFTELLEIAGRKGIVVDIHLSCPVKDIIDKPSEKKVLLEIRNEELYEFDTVIICTGHYWPRRNEGKIKGYFDSPYPPRKLMNQYNHPIAIKGSSLTAIDAVVTLANIHGRFATEDSNKLTWIANEETPGFKMIMHSLDRLLPAIRIHLDDPQLKDDILLSEVDIFRHIMENDGFLSLDWLFEKNFKEPMKSRDPEVYKQVRDMNIEEFVKATMQIRKQADPFQLFKAEYQEANQSIINRKSVYWKELLAALNFVINYPAKHLSAEDMVRLQKVLMPLIGIIIAFVPQESCEQLIALHEAGRLEIVSVEEANEVEPFKDGGIIFHYKDESGTEHHTRYRTYIDCTGQPQLSLQEIPFKSLRKEDSLSAAKIRFRSTEAAMKEKEKGNKEVVVENDNWYLRVPGIAITDNFAPINKNGKINPRIYLLATPFISGFNPDFSGLDFCATAAKIVAEDIHD